MSDYIPDDIVLGILARCSPEQIWEMRRVSRNWLRMVRSPAFHREMVKMLKNDEESASPSSLLIKKEWDADFHIVPIQGEISELVVSPPYSPVPRKRMFCYVGVCGGLLCVAAWQMMYTHVYIINPMSLNYISVNSPENVATGIDDVDSTFGWGFSQGSKQFKIVYLNSKGPGETELLVYTLCRNSDWRRVICDTKPDGFHIEGKNNIVIGDALLYICQRIVGNTGNAILAFNFSTEKLHITDLPTQLKDSRATEVIIGKSKGSVLILRQDALNLEIWVKDNQKSIWELIYKFEPPSWGNWYFYFMRYLVVEGEDAVVMKDKRCVNLYRPRTDIMRHQVFGFDFDGAVPFRGTHISPTMLTSD